MPKALVESFTSQIEFRDKLAKQLEIQLRTLVAGESSEDSVPSKASDISLDFYDGKTGNSAGKKITISATYLNVSEVDNVPDYAPAPDDEKSPSSGIRTYVLSRQNRDYYREYVDYLVKTAMLQSAGFSLTNNGVLGARDVFLDLRITTDIPDLTIGTNRKLKISKPEKEKDSTFSFSLDDAFSGISGDMFQVEKTSEGWTASVEARALQPKRVVKSRHSLVVGAKSSGKIYIDAKIYADILPEPVTQKLEISVDVTEVEVTAVELLRQNEILIFDSSQSLRRRRTIRPKAVETKKDEPDI